MVDTVSVLRFFPTHRACPVGGIDQGRVRKGQQVLMQGVVEHAGQVCGRDPDRRHEIGTSDIANKQGIPCQHGIGVLGILLKIIDENGNGLRGVPWSCENLHPDLSTGERFAMRKRRKGELGLCLGPQANGGAKSIPQFDMTGEEISVKMGQKDVRDVATVLGCVL